MILTCRDLSEALTDHDEGKLGALDRVGFSAHLLWCDSCRNYIHQMKITVEAASKLPAPKPSDEVRARLKAQWKR